MKHAPFDIGTVHFIGIGGIGMSGIAEVMHNLGYRVQGSDIARNANFERLASLGIHVIDSQRAENIAGVSVVVISSAIRDDNPELISAREKGLPIVRRAEMLAELMRLKWTVSVAGTHGKTTTTSMIAGLFDTAHLDPTVINGGIINQYGTNARLGEGDWMVVEADESDGTFVRLPATIAVVTNIDPEHLDFYGDFDAEKAAFMQFLERVPFYGAAVLCIDHPEVQQLIPKIANRKILTYGLSPQSDVQAQNLVWNGTVGHFDVHVRPRETGGDARVIKDIRLPIPGIHNVQNALAAIAVGVFMDMPDDVLRDAFASFAGVKRRFTKTGEVGGVSIIDDYGHHPVEIKAVLKAARASFSGKVTAVVQPHRYSRLKSLFDDFCTCFNDADAVIVAPVYAAGEAAIEGADRDALANGLKERGVREVNVIDGPDEIATLVSVGAQDGDVVVCLGAGSITQWAHDLPKALEAVID